MNNHCKIKKIKKAIIIFLLLSFATPSYVFSSTVLPVYEPYTEDEFPDWLKKIRRLEVITLGATALTYPIVGIFAKSGTFNDSTMSGFWAKFGLSAGIGFVIAITDLIIGEVQEKHERDRQNKIKEGEITVPVITLDPNSSEAQRLDEQRRAEEN